MEKGKGRKTASENTAVFSSRSINGERERKGEGERGREKNENHGKTMRMNVKMKIRESEGRTQKSIISNRDETKEESSIKKLK
jgi:hypothetical protein